MLKTTLLIIAVTLFFSCGKCGLSINLGEFLLKEESKEFFVYDNNQILIFEDQDGNDQKLVVDNEKAIYEINMIVRTLCEEGIIDSQHEYYKTLNQQISFKDSSERRIIALELVTHFEDADDIDSIAVYDVIGVRGNLFNGDEFIARTSCNIITSIHQNSISDEHRNIFEEEASFIGDTILFGTEFKEVFKSNSRSTPVPSTIFFSKIDGVVMIYVDDNNYLKLSK